MKREKMENQKINLHTYMVKDGAGELDIYLGKKSWPLPDITPQN